MKRPTRHSLRQSTAAISARKALTSRDYTAINAAIERHLDLACTNASQEAIQHCVGAEEFRKIEEIISFSENQDAWLQDNNLSSAADKVAARLSQEYPLLSERAVFKIINQATYGWR
jgi:hypothetical protein